MHCSRDIFRLRPSPRPKAHAVAAAYELTGVEFEEKLDSVVIEMAAVQDDLDQWGKAALPGHGH